ncbi:immunoglobulin domain-containing protein [Streptomyces sp. NPDC059744]|uniref:immunoglobulin domain-containing protein n=1 Tax=Streptomyces sp. NPDC059744 TaxID=3346929 RepID=UPI0036525AB6
MRTQTASGGGLTAGPGDPRLVVAGGGGGGAGSDNQVISAGGPSGGSAPTGAGAGGDIDCQAGTPSPGGTGQTGGGGGAAGQVLNNSAPGCLSSSGTAGTPGAGGTGANGDPISLGGAGGGGGGGGFTGGGGGASSNPLFTAHAASAGGGGGSSFGPAGTSFTTATNTGNGSVTISYTVNTPPVITGQPKDQTVNPGQDATFTATASGDPAPTVQWQRRNSDNTAWTNIPGATTITYTLTKATAADNGGQFRAVFTNTVGTATTQTATLIVTVHRPRPPHHHPCEPPHHHCWPHHHHR